MRALRAARAIAVVLGLAPLGCSERNAPPAAARREPRPAAELLFEKAREGDADGVLAQLARGAEINRRDADGQTPLLVAVRHGRSEAVKRLLERGADPNDEVYPWSALRLASFVGDAASVEALLERGARIDAPSDHGLTALMYAAGRGHAAVVRTLLARGAAVAARDEGGHTPLMFAANAGHADAAQALLKAGADASARNRAGETAARMAEANGHAASSVLALRPSPPAPPARDGLFEVAARTAWRYVEARYRPETGLVDGAVGWEHVTMWDAGSVLAAYHSARELGLLEDADYARRIERALRTLRELPLTEGVTFGRAYSTRGGATTPGGGWSPTDLGRLFLWLKIIAARDPQHAAAAEAVVRRSNFVPVLRDGYMWGARSQGGKREEFQEGRIGYEQYAAAGFAAWGLPVEKATSFTRHALTIKVLGKPVVADRRGYDRLTSDPLVLYGLELGWPDEARALAEGLLAAQQERWRRTGKVTIVSEDAVGVPPHFFYYYCAYTNAKEFAVDVQDHDAVVSGPRWVSSKAAFAWHALLPGDYTRRAVDAVEPARTGRGWASGVFEGSHRSTGSENINTQAIILEAAAYAKRGAALQEAR